MRGSRTRGSGINNVIQQDNEQGGFEDCNKTKQAVTISEEPIHTHASNIPPPPPLPSRVTQCIRTKPVVCSGVHRFLASDSLVI